MRVVGFVVQHNVGVCCFWLMIMGFFALGLPRITTSVQLMKLFDDNAEIRHDYAWLEAHLGNLVPMEIIIPLDPAQMRTGDNGELAEANGKRYRQTMLERVRMVKRIRDRVEALPQIGRALSVASFVPDDYWEVYGGGDYAANKQLEKSRDRFLDGDYLQEELDEDGKPTGREIWRVSARVRALDDGRGQEMDYGEFVHELRAIVDPILLAYRQRDEILRQLDEQGERLSTSRLVVLFRGPNGTHPPENTQEHLLVDLLRESGPRTDRQDGKPIERILPLNLAMLELNEKMLSKARKAIEPLEYDAAIIVSAGSRDVDAKRLTAGILPLIDVSNVPEPAKDGSSAATWVVNPDEPHPVAAVYTGVVPLVYKTQRQLLYSLRQSIGWATVLIALVMVCVLRSPFAGLVSMIPNVFPIVLVFGALGWLGIKVDIGIMMTASVALGVAVDDTIHFVWWFRHGIEEGMDRHKATLYAYERCGTAMTQTTLIAGFGLAVFATSTFTPTQQFGYLMITILSTALIGDLLLLPAILSGPVGKIFRARSAGDGETGEQHAPTSDEAVPTSDVDPPPTHEPTPKLRAAPETVDAATPAAHRRLRDAAKRSARAS
jgi:predicted RND superfamily exporter protein